jgi:hypothetical protein
MAGTRIPGPIGTDPYGMCMIDEGTVAVAGARAGRDQPAGR